MQQCSFNPANGNCKADVTSGADQIPTILVRECAEGCAYSLTLLYNLILQKSSFLCVWKISMIVPVFRSGDRDGTTNYRPISILHDFAKVFEQILYQEIYCKCKPYLSINQYGFVSSRSTVTDSAIITQQISIALDRRLQVVVTYAGFSKALDRTDHDIPLSKLDITRFCTSLLRLFSSSYFCGSGSYISLQIYPVGFIAILVINTVR